MALLFAQGKPFWAAATNPRTSSVIYSHILNSITTYRSCTLSPLYHHQLHCHQGRPRCTGSGISWEFSTIVPYELIALSQHQLTRPLGVSYLTWFWLSGHWKSRSQRHCKSRGLPRQTWLEATYRLINVLIIAITSLGRDAPNVASAVVTSAWIVPSSVSSEGLIVSIEPAAPLLT